MPKQPVILQKSEWIILEKLWEKPRSLMQLVHALQSAIDKGELPTPIEFAVQMGWTTVLLGSVVSLPLAFLARLRAKR